MSVPAFSISSTKPAYKIYISFRISAMITTLKTFFSSSLTISFSLDVVYWADCVSPFLLNQSSWSMIKQMSNAIAMLTCFWYIPSFLRLYWTKVSDYKSTWIGNTFARDSSAGNVSLWDTYVDIELFGISWWSLINMISIKYDFINILLNLVGLWSSLMITDSSCMLIRL